MNIDLNLDIPLPKKFLKKSLLYGNNKQNKEENIYTSYTHKKEDFNEYESLGPKINKSSFLQSSKNEKKSFNKYDTKLSFRKPSNFNQSFNYERFYKDQSIFQDYEFKGNFALLEKVKKGIIKSRNINMCFFYFLILFLDFCFLYFFDYLTEKNAQTISFFKLKLIFIKNFSVFILLQLFWNTNYFQYDKIELRRCFLKLDLNLILSFLFVICFLIFSLNILIEKTQQFLLTSQIAQLNSFNFLLVIYFLNFFFSLKSKKFANLTNCSGNFLVKKFKENLKKEFLVFVLIFSLSVIITILYKALVVEGEEFNYYDHILELFSPKNILIFSYQFFFCFLTIKIYVYLSRFFYISKFAEKFYDHNNIKKLLDLLIEIEMDESNDVENFIIQKHIIEFILKNLKIFRILYFTITEENDNVIKYWKMFTSIYLFNFQKIEDTFLSKNLHKKLHFDLFSKIFQFGTYYFYNSEKRLAFLKNFHLLKNFQLKTELLKKLVLQNKFDNCLSLKINEIKTLLDLLFKNKVNIQNLLSFEDGEIEDNEIFSEGHVLTEYSEIILNIIDLLEVMHPVIFGVPVDLRIN